MKFFIKKKFLAILLIFHFASQIFSQSQDFKKREALVRDDTSECSLEFLIEFEKEAENYYDDKNFLFSITAYRKAAWYAETGKNQEAMNELVRTLEILNSQQNVNEDYIANISHMLVEFLNETKIHESSEENFKKAVSFFLKKENFARKTNQVYVENKSCFFMFFKNAETEAKKYFNKNDFSFAVISFWIAETAEGDLENLKMRTESYNRVLSILRSQEKKMENFLANAEYSVAEYFYELGFYDLSLDGFNRALEKNCKLYGEKTLIVSIIYNYIASIFLIKTDFEETERNIEKSVSIIEEIEGKDSLNFLSLKSFQGTILAEKGDYDGALKIYEECRILAEASADAKGLLAAILENMGGIYANFGDFDRALAYFDDSLSIYNELFGENSAECINALVNKARLLYEKRKFTDSMRLLQNAMVISTSNSKFGSTFTSVILFYADVLNEMSVADSFLNSGVSESDKDKIIKIFNSETFMENAKALYPEYSGAKTILDCSLYMYEMALKLSAQVVSDENSTVASCYIGLGKLYRRVGKHEKSLEVLDSALEILKEKFGEHHMYFGYVYSAQAFTYYRMGEKKKAFECWRKAFVSWENSTEYMEILGNIEDIIREGVDDEAFMVEMFDFAKKLSERGRLFNSTMKSQISAKSLPIFYQAIEFFVRIGDAGKAFEYSESIKNRNFLDEIGTENALRLDGITREEQEKVKKLISEIEIYRRQIEKYEKEKVSKAMKKLPELEGELSTLDKKLSKRNPKYGLLRNPSVCSVAEAQKWVGKNAVAIEYVIYQREHALDRLEKESGSYCIVITNKKKQVVQLDSKYDYNAAIKKVYDGVSKLSREERFETERNELYEKLISPVLPHIKGKKRLVLIPDGNLSVIPFDILRKSDGSKMLGEQFAVSLSPSVSVSIIAKDVQSKIESVLAFGGAWYDKNLSEEEHNAILAGGKSYQKRGSGWGDLPGTIKELGALKSDVFSGKNFAEITQKDATEAKVKKLSRNGTLSRHSIVHFACHGYFSKGTNDEPTSILFSEISGKFSENSDEDGYLTIPEAALLNLKAQMVCLSACETGIVDNSVGNGMVGLSRSFMVAGAKRVGVSLWEASDEAAAEFMTKMYKKVLAGMDYAEAYKKTKGEFRKSENWSHPFYWALYTLYE